MIKTVLLTISLTIGITAAAGCETRACDELAEHFLTDCDLVIFAASGPCLLGSEVELSALACHGISAADYACLETATCDEAYFGGACTREELVDVDRTCHMTCIADATACGEDCDENLDEPNCLDCLSACDETFWSCGAGCPRQTD